MVLDHDFMKQIANSALTSNVGIGIGASATPRGVPGH